MSNNTNILLSSLLTSHRSGVNSDMPSEQLQHLHYHTDTGANKAKNSQYREAYIFLEEGEKILIEASEKEYVVEVAILLALMSNMSIISKYLNWTSPHIEILTKILEGEHESLGGSGEEAPKQRGEEDKEKRKKSKGLGEKTRGGVEGVKGVKEIKGEGTDKEGEICENKEDRGDKGEKMGFVVKVYVAFANNSWELGRHLVCLDYLGKAMEILGINEKETVSIQKIQNLITSFKPKNENSSDHNFIPSSYEEVLELEPMTISEMSNILHNNPQMSEKKYNCIKSSVCMNLAFYQNKHKILNKNNKKEAKNCALKALQIYIEECWNGNFNDAYLNQILTFLNKNFEIRFIFPKNKNKIIESLHREASVDQDRIKIRQGIEKLKKIVCQDQPKTIPEVDSYMLGGNVSNKKQQRKVQTQTIRKKKEGKLKTNSITDQRKYSYKSFSSKEKSIKSQYHKKSFTNKNSKGKSLSQNKKSSKKSKNSKTVDKRKLSHNNFAQNNKNEEIREKSEKYNDEYLLHSVSPASGATDCEFIKIHQRSSSEPKPSTLVENKSVKGRVHKFMHGRSQSFEKLILTEKSLKKERKLKNQKKTTKINKNR